MLHKRVLAHACEDWRNRMERLKTLAFASCLGILGTAFVPTASADTWNKRTILTVSESIMVPNQVLPPGKYVIKLLESQSNRHIVQVFDETERRLLTTVLAVPNYRLQPTGNTQFGFYETVAGQPRAVRSWFYPGDNFGQEFVYPKDTAMMLAKGTQQQVPMTDATNQADLSSARVSTIDEMGTQRELPRETYTRADGTQSNDQPAQNPVTTTEQAATPVAPEPPQAPVMAPAPVQQADRLPETASPFTLMGLLGLASIGAAGVVRAAHRR